MFSMADPTELKNMIMSLRVSELQVLLGFAGRNRSGRKAELLSRALSLLEKGAGTPIQIKIRELYRRRFPKTGIGSEPQQLKGQNSNPLAPPYPHSRPVDYKDYNRVPIQTPSPHSHSHSSHSQIPVHPDVRLKKLPFYDILGELLKPSSLAPRSSSRFQETFFIFHLTPQQAQDISSSRDLRPGARCDYTVQVQLRFCLLETSCEQEDNFPPSICVRVNGKMAPLPNPIPTNKAGVEPKRPKRPVNITSICRISPTVPNHINISWASELGRSYCVAVYLVRRLNSDVLLSRLKHKGIRHPDHTRALIKEKLAHDPDSEIATTSLRVSLMCPLGKMRMSVPCRPKSCNHLQCFDAPMFLQMNEKKPTWNCPVCDCPAEFDKLFIDGLFTDMLQKAPHSPEIEFDPEGNWQSSLKEKDQKVSVANVSLTDIETLEGAESDLEEISNTIVPKVEGGGGAAGGFIDLTETDDEEEEPSQVVFSSASESSTSSCSSTSSSSLSVISHVPTTTVASNSNSNDEPVDLSIMEVMTPSSPLAVLKTCVLAAGGTESDMERDSWRVVEPVADTTTTTPLKLRIKKFGGGSSSDERPSQPATTRTGEASSDPPFPSLYSPSNPDLLSSKEHDYQAALQSALNDSKKSSHSTKRRYDDHRSVSEHSSSNEESPEYHYKSRKRTRSHSSDLASKSRRKRQRSSSPIDPLTLSSPSSPIEPSSFPPHMLHDDLASTSRRKRQRSSSPIDPLTLSSPSSPIEPGSFSPPPHMPQGNLRSPLLIDDTIDPGSDIDILFEGGGGGLGDRDSMLELERLLDSPPRFSSSRPPSSQGDSPPPLPYNSGPVFPGQDVISLE